jgi:hypothetical protein
MRSYVPHYLEVLDHRDVRKTLLVTPLHRKCDLVYALVDYRCVGKIKTMLGEVGEPLRQSQVNLTLRL